MGGDDLDDAHEPRVALLICICSILGIRHEEHIIWIDLDATSDFRQQALRKSLSGPHLHLQYDLLIALLITLLITLLIARLIRPP
jgi:hypothetical protein